MRTSRFAEEQIIGVSQEAEVGLPGAELVRKHGISPQPFSRWKSKYGVQEVGDARRLKPLGDENRRLAGPLRSTWRLGGFFKESRRIRRTPANASERTCTLRNTG